MSDGRSDPKAPLRPMAPPFGGLRSARPLTRGTGTPARPVTPIAAPVVPATPEPPEAAVAHEDQADALARGSGSNPAVEPQFETAPEAQMPRIDDFLSFVGSPTAERSDEPVARLDEADLAKSAHGDELFTRTIPSVPETVAAEAAPETEHEGHGGHGGHEEPTAGFAAPVSPARFSGAMETVESVDVDADTMDLDTQQSPDAEAQTIDLYEEAFASGEIDAVTSPVDDSPSASALAEDHGLDWQAEPWPADEPIESAVVARPTPHDIAAIQAADEDPFGWDTPLGYDEAEMGIEDRTSTESPVPDPFEPLRDVPPYDEALASMPDAGSSPWRAGTVPVAEEAQGPASVYEQPDDAAAWSASATSRPSAGPDVGRRAASVLENLAADVRTGRLRIEAGEHTSPAGVLASLLATLLSPTRPE